MMSKSQKESAPSSGSRWKLVVVGVFVVAFGLGALLPHLGGYGWFGYRALLYGESQLYVLNVSDEPRNISVDERPFETVDAEGARLLPLVGGVSSVRVQTQHGESLREWTVETVRSDVFLNLSEATCLVVSELSGLSEQHPLEVDIVDRLGPETEIYQLESTNVVWPRAYPKTADEDHPDPIRSIEIIDCDLLDDEPFLEDYVETRIERRLG